MQAAELRARLDVAEHFSSGPPQQTFHSSNCRRRRLVRWSQRLASARQPMKSATLFLSHFRSPSPAQLPGGVFMSAAVCVFESCRKRASERAAEQPSGKPARGSASAFGLAPLCRRQRAFEPLGPMQTSAVLKDARPADKKCRLCRWAAFCARASGRPRAAALLRAMLTLATGPLIRLSWRPRARPGNAPNGQRSIGGAVQRHSSRSDLLPALAACAIARRITNPLERLKFDEDFDEWAAGELQS